MRSAISSATRVFLIGSISGNSRPAARRREAPAALDRPGSGCQTRPPNWFDHRASLADRDCRLQIADCRLKLQIEFVANGSPKVVSRAIEEFARGQGHVTAIVVPWESDGDHAEHGGHRGQERRLGDRAHQPGDHPARRRGTGPDRRWPSPPSCRTIPSRSSSPRSSTASSGRSRAGFTSNPSSHDHLVRRSRAGPRRRPRCLPPRRSAWRRRASRTSATPSRGWRPAISRASAPGPATS